MIRPILILAALSVASQLAVRLVLSAGWSALVFVAVFGAIAVCCAAGAVYCYRFVGTLLGGAR